MRLVLHVGVHKTGTTFLQRSYWASHPRVIMPLPPDVFARSVLDGGTASRDELYRTVDVAMSTAVSGSVVVLSSERMWGSPHAGCYDRWILGDRLAEWFPYAHVLVHLREQTAAIASMYRQYVWETGSKSLVAYLHGTSKAVT